MSLNCITVTFCVEYHRWSNWLSVCINLQFRAQILSIDRNDDIDNDVEPSNDDDVEPADEEQTTAEPSVSNFVTDSLFGSLECW